MDNPTINCRECAGKLQTLLVQLQTNNDTQASEQTWHDVEITTQNLANGLRVRGGPDDNHTMLGLTSLPQTLTALLRNALNGSSIPTVEHSAPVYEILRVGANLCMDHDQNRFQLLEARFPQAIVSLLEGYADTVPSGLQKDPLPLSIPHLKVIKTAIGVLLNASIGYEPVKFRLTSLEVAMTLMRLSCAIYPTGSWLTSHPVGEVNSEDDIAESWSLRSVISNWAWRTLSELKEDSRSLFDPDVLAYLIPSLLAYTPPLLTAQLPAFIRSSPHLYTSLLQTDFDLLEESCMLLESLSLDVEDVRLSLARGFNFEAEHLGVPCLSAMLDFIEKGSYPLLWYDKDAAPFDVAEIKSKEKGFDICKAAVIKVVVEVAGDEKNQDVLWDTSEEEMPGGEFVSRMVDWIRSYVDSETGAKVENLGRDDLAICACLALGNLTRRESYATILLSPPHSIASLLCQPVMLSPSTDIKLKHSVMGLLKHLSQSSSLSVANRDILSNAKTIERVVESGIWDERSDAMAEIVQVSAIGIVKHLCNSSVDNSFALVFPTSEQDPSASTGLSQILALVKRSDTVAVKSEGTRVLVNVIKSLWSSDPSQQDSQAEEVKDRQLKREMAIEALLTPSCTEALAGLIGRSMKYPILINEGVVALSLLSTHRNGGPLVLQALVVPLPVEAAPAGSNSLPPSAPPSLSATASTSSELDSPIVNSPTRSRPPSPRGALDQLINVLRNTSNTDHVSNNHRAALTGFPVEVRANVCALLGQVGKQPPGEDVERVKDATKGILEELSRGSTQSGRDGMLGAAAKRVLDAWV
ncbi:hypothetical protein SERLA73DRAFT_64433 [Serpula lacrymans var. lacrymans S7.3]|uniref:Uncharacterized protein n=2 Tax=Serpula lacrymans var. lacrymans TaxID=341189 RepID=F8QEH3_SERL3|nr:uncharacterized protein SERLADRAFT_454188 [Serpula lacrymans var. lacrymans S7.9]EGN93229.1 hypothetical protein SERLA73DRAFT_64433 [Serpula lacrymans var. lacrymans S7.3]EGO18614.1 hypothetical protein SERLADRAFT_454188 [Serpula lacrymans var. lacrymans S7.9]